MINEIYRLSTAMEQASIQGEQWHRKYIALPNVSSRAPCIRVLVNNKHIDRIESVSADVAEQIRKYGSNQGYYPAMNLAPLYQIADEEKKKRIAGYLKGNISEFDSEEVLKWCKQNNWSEKFMSKFRISMVNVPNELRQVLSRTGSSFPPLEVLFDELSELSDPFVLHKELDRIARQMVKQKSNLTLALQLLFFCGNVEKEYGKISVVFDSQQLVAEGIPVVNAGFTKTFNQVLLQADERTKGQEGTDCDAFGQPFAPLEEPMPSVKLPAGFDVTLRTMFHGQPCQTRYGRIENATYPISRELRLSLQSALTWMSTKEQKEITWVNTDKGEVLFAYPENMPQNKKLSLTSMYKRRSPEARFNAESKQFLEQIVKEKKPGADPKDARIQIFILRKIDKARTKVVFTYNTTPREISTATEMWSSGCQNLPLFQFGQPDTLFPLELANVMNRVWKQDGTLATDKFKPYSRYYGMELLFGTRKQPQQELYALVTSLSNVAAFIGSGLASEKNLLNPSLITQVKDALSALGLVLFILNVRKENYMQEFPYLFGQLLKVSDSLHEMYCRVVRNGDVPPQLAGSSFYSEACEQPLRAFAQLGQRMNPYITWAKHYRTKNIIEKGKESGIVGWYLSLYEQIASQLPNALEQKTRFNDAEKAELFIGYLAAFPKKEKTTGGSENE